MGKLFNRAMMTVAAAPGTGAITLGSAVPGYLSFAASGVADGDVISYVAESSYSNGRPSVFEFGAGTYSSTGPTLTRTTVVGGSSGTSPVALTADAQVFVNPLAADIPGPRWDVVVEDQKASGTSAGTSTAATWVTRVFNTVVKITLAGASLSGNQLTLPAGTYEVEWDVPAYHTTGHISRLYNVSDSAVIAMGTSEYLNNGLVQSRSFGRAEITLATAKTIRVEHWIASADANGLGVYATSGSTEVYARMRVKRIG